MNVISNTCVGSYIYRLSNNSFKNPFTWNVIKYKSFKNLILNYDKIDFTKIKAYSVNDCYAAIKIDDKVVIDYIHYKNSNSEHLSKNRNDLYLENYIGYAQKTYFKRLERMTETPTFVIHAQTNNTMNDFTLKNLIELDSLKFKYKVFVIHNYKEFKPKNKNIISLYIDSDIINMPEASAKKVYKTILNRI